jgi:Replication initiator protein A
MSVNDTIWHPKQLDLLLDADAISRTVGGPKLFFIAPFFPGVANKMQHEVEHGDRIYRIGGVHPFPRPEIPLPRALDIRHCRALFVLLSFRNENGNQGRIISFSMYEFSRRFASSVGGAYHRHLKQLLGDLADTWIQITEKSTGKVFYARLLDKMDVCQTPIRRSDAPDAVNGQMTLRIQAAVVSDWFYEMLSCIIELMWLKLDVFTSIRSPNAQSLYMFLPSRAVGKTEQNPWEINLTKLLGQIGYDHVPTSRSKRIQLFTQNKNSVISQINGIPISKGALRAALRIPQDRKKDAFLQVWQELPKDGGNTINPNSKVYQAWTLNGGTPAEFSRRLKLQRPITEDYALSLLRAAGVNLAKDHVFLRQVRALIGDSEFLSCLAETKGSGIEPGFTVKKSLGALMGGRLMNAVKLAARSSQPSREAIAKMV